MEKEKKKKKRSLISSAVRLYARSTSLRHYARLPLRIGWKFNAEDLAAIDSRYMRGVHTPASLPIILLGDVYPAAANYAGSIRAAGTRVLPIFPFILLFDHAPPDIGL